MKSYKDQLGDFGFFNKFTNNDFYERLLKNEKEHIIEIKKENNEIKRLDDILKRITESVNKNKKDFYKLNNEYINIRETC